MKNLIFTTIILLSLNAAVLGNSDSKGKQITDSINWPKFLNRHDLVWDRLPETWYGGAFLGNGLLGSVIYQNDSNQICWEMGRSDVTTHRRDNNRLPIGRLLLETKGDIISGEMRLDLWNAETTATIKTNKGTLKLKSYIHSEELVLLVEVKGTGEEKNARFIWQADEAIDHVNKRRFDDPPNPPAIINKTNNNGICIQPRIGGGEYATAWQVVQVSDKERIVYLTIADSYPQNTAEQEAKQLIKELVPKSLDKLNQEHRNWWHQFYPKSFISIPDMQVESFYWIQMYKLACATRNDRMLIDLLGPWYKKTSWPRIWWNLNIEIAYFPVYTSNHLELGESFTRMMDKNRTNFQRNAKELYGIDDGATVPHTTCYEGLRGDGSRAPDKYINPGDFTWALYNYWLHYRYSMDQSILTDQKSHAFFPLLKGSINTLIKLLTEEEDGRLHLPVLMSPEYAQVADNNYNLSLLRWGCQTLLNICKTHNIDDPLVPKWQEILDKLVDYPVNETGFMIGKDMPLTKSHRHWQHLQMIFPLNMLDLENTEVRSLAKKSIEHWLKVDNSKQIYGWSDAAASCLYSILGNGEMALKHLKSHHNNKRFVQPNTMYIEGSPVIECSLFAAKSLQDMLIQSWGNKIRIFPAIPESWDDAIFHNLRTEGAFLVSASRSKSKTDWIRVESLAGEPCSVISGMKGEIKLDAPSNVTMKYDENGTIHLTLKKGQTALLYSESTDLSTIIKPLEAKPKDCNYYGLNSRN